MLSKLLCLQRDDSSSIEGGRRLEASVASICTPPIVPATLRSTPARRLQNSGGEYLVNIAPTSRMTITMLSGSFSGERATSSLVCQRLEHLARAHDLHAHHLGDLGRQLVGLREHEDVVDAPAAVRREEVRTHGDVVRRPTKGLLRPCGEWRR